MRFTRYVVAAVTQQGGVKTPPYSTTRKGAFSINFLCPRGGHTIFIIYYFLSIIYKV